MEGRENDARGVREAEEGRGNVEEEEGGLERGRPADARKGGKEEGREDENDGGRGEETESEGRMCSILSFPRSKPTNKIANLSAC